MELWGGVECTVNRVGDAYYDQSCRSGHHARADDIDRFAALGMRALRFPILWERVAPRGLAQASWDWTDDRLARVARHGIRPIATLLHHGSGPHGTDLLDDGFPEALAGYAGAVAERYPWITDFTPVNEPLTTARFSALYGHWYPHRRDDRGFVRALLNETRGTVLAMERIRRTTPSARLVSTEDAGRVMSTPALAYQAEFENHRRWLTTDLLCGFVDRNHPLWAWLIGSGARAGELDWIRDRRAAPDVLGLNYYLTSDRFLDDRLWLYPGSTAGGNGRDLYVDTEAVRVPSCPPPSHAAVLEEAWQRYRLPVALTEVHVGCTREEQLRWFLRAWRGAGRARDAGADVVAVTAWSLLGAFDWNSLVTCADGVYEPGVFDVRSDPPRPTALARLVTALASNTSYDALADEPGWWERGAPAIIRRRLGSCDRSARPILIAGAGGVIGSAVVDACAERGLSAVAVDRRELDATDAAAVARAMIRVRPWAVVNAAGTIDVDGAEEAPRPCWHANTRAAATLAAAAAAFHARFVSFSADLVFDGEQGRSYVESDAPNPLNQFGHSKSAAERAIRGRSPEALVIRTAACFAPEDADGFLARALREVRGGRQVYVPDDLIVSPAYVPHLVSQALDLLVDGERGLWHLVNQGACSWAAFVAAAVRGAGLDASAVRGVPAQRLGLRARRPRLAALASERGQLMPSLDRALAEYCAVAATLWREPLVPRQQTRPGLS